MKVHLLPQPYIFPQDVEARGLLQSGCPLNGCVAEKIQIEAGHHDHIEGIGLESGDLVGVHTHFLGPAPLFLLLLLVFATLKEFAEGLSHSECKLSKSLLASERPDDSRSDLLDDDESSLYNLFDLLLSRLSDSLEAHLEHLHC